jgi:hypothetical protein
MAVMKFEQGLGFDPNNGTDALLARLMFGLGKRFASISGQALKAVRWNGVQLGVALRMVIKETAQTDVKRLRTVANPTRDIKSLR